MKTTIVLADDHRIVCDGLTLLLEAQGTYQVVATAFNGLDALRSVEQNKPDIAIFDIWMPAINGIVAAEQVHSRSPETKVIILSMYADRSHVLQALRAHVCGYVLKESAAGDLLAAIERVMAGHRYLSQKLTDILVEHYVAQRPENSALQQNEVQLSRNERKILRLVAEGRSSAQIGETLGLASTTVDTYRSRIMQKLKVNNTAGLMKFAIRSGLVNIWDPWHAVVIGALQRTPSLESGVVAHFWRAHAINWFYTQGQFVGFKLLPIRRRSSDMGECGLKIGYFR